MALEGFKMEKIELASETKDGQRIATTTDGHKIFRFGSAEELADRLSRSGIEPMPWKGALQDF